MRAALDELQQVAQARASVMLRGQPTPVLIIGPDFAARLLPALGLPADGPLPDTVLDMPCTRLPYVEGFLVLPNIWWL